MFPFLVFFHIFFSTQYCFNRNCWNHEKHTKYSNCVVWACAFRIIKIMKFLCFFSVSPNIALKEMLENVIFSKILLYQQCDFDLSKKHCFVEDHRICYVNRQVASWKIQFFSTILNFSSYYNTFNFTHSRIKVVHGAYESIWVLEESARIQCRNLNTSYS